jgi:hypothetical protein
MASSGEYRFFFDELFSMILLALDVNQNARQMSNIIYSLPLNIDTKKKLFELSVKVLKGTVNLNTVIDEFPGRSFQQSDLIGSVSDSNRNPTKLDENFINRRNPIGFLVAIRHPDP